MPCREIFIYPPLQGALGATTWMETIVGGLIAPVLQTHRSEIEWYWFSRYAEPRTPGDVGIPTAFDLPDPSGPLLRHCKLRFHIADAAQSSFESDLNAACSGAGCHARLADYDLVGDLGGDRFVGDHARPSPARRATRARMVTSYLMAICELFVDALVQDGAKWRLEQNTGQPNNPFQSTFDSLLHMFCNITDTPAPVVAVPVSVTPPQVALLGWVYAQGQGTPIPVKL